MNEAKRRMLSELAEQSRSSTNPNQRALAQGLNELLVYVDDLLLTIDVVTETCYEAVSLSYENWPEPAKTL